MEYHELITFNKPLSKFMNRDNVAILAILTPRTNRLKVATPICVGNTHLLFNTKRGDIKLAQLAHLFAEIDRIAIGTDCRLPVVLCGDFNSTPFSPLYNFLTKGELSFNGISKTVISGQDDSPHRGANFKLNDRIFPPDLGYTHDCRWKDLSKKQNHRHWFDQLRGVIDLTSDASNRKNIETDRPGILTHNLDLSSSYMHRGLDGVKEVTTCHDRASATVDYIFHSTGVNPQTESTHGQLWLSGVLSLLSEYDVKRMGKLPNTTISSDHLLLMSSFVLT